jgi:hypothetical protein
LKRIHEQSVAESDHVSPVSARAGSSSELNVNDAVWRGGNPLSEGILRQRCIGDRRGRERDRDSVTDE